jgi:photosystem II stability/assembly factor-like uncharacterized protein
VDVSPGSPRVNSVYVSGVMWSEQGHRNQILVSHSTDGGVTWAQASVDLVQQYPQEDDLTRMAVGGDGTLYITWINCASPCSAARILFSKSTDGGNTWSPPSRLQL